MCLKRAIFLTIRPYACPRMRESAQMGDCELSGCCVTQLSVLCGLPVQNRTVRVLFQLQTSGREKQKKSFFAGADLK